MRVVYINASVALRAALPSHQRDAWRDWLTATKDGAPIVSARLLRTEMIRALRRDGIDLVEADKVLGRVRMLPVTGATFVDAEQIGPTVKTLDALHLASAQFFGRQAGVDLTLLTHDQTMRSVAETMGLRTFDPVGPDNTPHAVEWPMSPGRDVNPGEP